MSDFDFLKEFGKNLDRERPHDPTDVAWEKLDAALAVNDRAKRRRRLLVAWAFPVAASALLAVLGTMLWQTRNKTEWMQTEITRLQHGLDSKNLVLKQDTSVQHFTIIQYDTIFRTVLLRTIVPGVPTPGFVQRIQPTQDSIFQAKNVSGALAPKNPVSGGSNFAQNSIVSIDNPVRGNSNTVQNQALGTVPTPNSSALSVGDGPNTAAGNAPIAGNLVNKSLFNTDLAALPTKPLRAPNSQLSQKLPAAYRLIVESPAPLPHHVPIIRRLRPQNACVGIVGGILFPQYNEATLLNNYVLGVNSRVSFGKHWQLTAGAENGWANFRVNGTDLDNSNIPSITPPTLNDELKFVEVKQPLWDFSLGFRYSFAPAKRLQPFAGASWVAEQTEEQTLKYEFRNLVTADEIYTLIQRNDARFNPNGVQLGAGAVYSFAKSLSLGMEGIYQRHFTSSVPVLAERWGIKANIAYSF